MHLVGFAIEIYHNARPYKRQIYHFNPLNPELNPICYLLALLGAHHFLHVSRIRVKLGNIEGMKNIRRWRDSRLEDKVSDYAAEVSQYSSKLNKTENM